jgi:hypothetical protein
MSNTNQEHVWLPLWARVLDGVAVAAGLISIAVLLSGGFVLGRVGPFRISSHSVLRPLLVAVALVAIRHALAPAFPLHRRIADWIEPFSRDSIAAFTLAALVSRIAVLLVGYAAVLTIGLAQPYGFALSPDPLLNLPGRYDAGWYGMIALEGYHFDGRFGTQQNIAFFPAYPMLLRVVGFAVGAFEDGVSRDLRMARALWGGVIISVLAFVWAVSYFARLARETIGDANVPAAVSLLAAYPFAVFFSTPYAESLFLLGSVAAFYHFRRHEWLAAALWGALVGLTRPNGCLLSIVLACVAVEQLWRAPAYRKGAYSLPRAILSAAAPTVAVLAYSAYIRHLTGAWFGWAYAHEAWGRTFGGLTSFELLFEWIRDGVLMQMAGAAPVRALNALGAMFAFAMLWPAFRRVGLGGGALILVNVLPPILAGGAISMGRFTSTIFSIFLALAAILPRPLVMPVVAVFAIFQGLAAVLFFTWRELF